MPARRALLALAVTALAAGIARGQSLPIVERVEVAGNVTLRPETLLYYVSMRPGERYDERRLRDDYQRVWSTGLLEDLTLDVSEGARGKLVVFRVEERRRVRSVEYVGSTLFSSKKLSEELTRRGVEPRLGALLDPADVSRTEQAIREMLAKKGRTLGSVTHETRDRAGSGVALRFLIGDGPEVRVHEIAFEGNRNFSDGQLRGAMKELARGGLAGIPWLGGDKAWAPEKWSGGTAEQAGDRQRLLDFYRDRGYLAAEVGDPRVTTSEEASAGGTKRLVRLVIPVSEGPRYRVRDLRIDGLSVLSDAEVRPLFTLGPGDVYSASRLDEARQALHEMYGRRGYFRASSTLRTSPDPRTQTVGLVLTVDEDRLYSVGRIRFAGNRATRDKVIRREVFLNEGDVFDASALGQSIRRLNQLGYFRPIERMPDLELSSRTADAVDLTLRLEEENPIRFNWGGGYTGVQGGFLNANFVNANFLGRGDTLQVTAEKGTLSYDYGVAITRPYTFDVPLTTGLDVFMRRQSYKTETDQGVQGYDDRRSGFSLLAGHPVGRWARASLRYSYELVEIALRDTEGLENASLVQGIPASDVGTQHQSMLTPALVRNTLDHPLTPRRGTRLTGSLQLAGGPLGGTLDLVRPRIEAVAYAPFGERSALGVRAEAGWVKALGDTAGIDPATDQSRLPFYERFYLGGETQIRGYDVRAVGPRDASGRAIGGTRYLLLNAEYSRSIVGPLQLVLFCDAGQAYAEGQDTDLAKLNVSTGAELRLVLPFLNLPFRLFYAWNLNREAFHPPHALKFAVGLTF